jgi:UDP-2,3-diacylglucosamine pyrophosphatase LpxH
MNRYRTLFISDVHLGTPGCQAAFLLDFLRYNDAETIYLIGDIIDGWRLKKSWKLLKKARKGCRVIYVPGNHDEAGRQFAGMSFGRIRIRHEDIHVLADGRRLWVTHGDLFDGVMQYARWLAYLGDWLYSVILVANRWFNRLRLRLGYPYWSLSQYLKHSVKNAVSFISSFETMMAHETRRRGCDGVVCGHIHKAEIKMIDGVLYCNDGDWVESLTAMVEHFDGRLEIVHWNEITSSAAVQEPQLLITKVSVNIERALESAE